MRIIKKINNNFALAQDDAGRSLIAYGKGIGFPQVPYELNDLSKIDRTFYDVKDEHIPLFQETDERIITLAIELLDYIRANLNKDISDYLYYVLVDHINFAIKRFKNNVYVPMNLSREIKFNYQEEYDVAFQCWKIINKRMNVSLPKDEASIIAMHIVESEEISTKSDREININSIVDTVMRIIKEELKIEIDSNNFNVYRFETHLKYLIQRLQDGDFEAGNEEMYEVMKQKYSNINLVNEKICEYLGKELNVIINESEKLYLMMHINRLSEKESG